MKGDQVREKGRGFLPVVVGAILVIGILSLGAHTGLDWGLVALGFALVIIGIVSIFRDGSFQTRDSSHPPRAFWPVITVAIASPIVLTLAFEQTGSGHSVWGTILELGALGALFVLIVVLIRTLGKEQRRTRGGSAFD